MQAFCDIKPFGQEVCILQSCRKINKHILSIQGNNKVQINAVKKFTLSVVTDEQVPEGHKSLHNLLYDNGDVHSGKMEYQFKKGEDDATVLMDINYYIQSRENQKPAGVFAIYDQNKVIQYISYSRNIQLTVKDITARVDPTKCAQVKVQIYKGQLLQRQYLEEVVEQWVKLEDFEPEYNTIQQSLWEGKTVKTNVMNQQQLEKYEDIKFKLQKAMGESNEEEDLNQSQKERREKTIKALESDDWSAVIDEQTESTIENGQKLDSDGQVVSPFEKKSSNGNSKLRNVKISLEAVDQTLNEVRPYLISDGGNVDVEQVTDGVVYLRLQGACGSCSSSSTTMKQGIEKCLKDTFGEQLKEVIQVGQEDNSPTVANIDRHLGTLRGAIEAYGGNVSVKSVERGICFIDYKGPPPIFAGISAAVRDKFPQIELVHNTHKG